MSEGKKEKPGKVKETHGTYFIDERYEIIGGVRYDFLTSPKFSHQDALGRLYIAFHSACSEDGVILLAPMDVHFDEENILQPDILYIRGENRGIIRDGYVYGAPDLVVEILSGSTARRDKTLKKSTYEKFGVGEYWLVDPVYRLVEQFAIVDGEYRLLATWSEEDVLVAATVACLTVDLSAVFRKEES
ncbi:Uma2 family endonuclease [Cohnella sp. SGD-V74]|uniref:Uma2 family endonuclease n=1 Tax=unclassified Cohnella TaxID=2636738 RepID=UPI000D45C5C9|nr:MULTISPECIES: Uma2 family endonuclease [unclassified Cohnella]PRX61506.1 Uma2 family endonuclease [Cohnella sp. SGD-V74]